MKKLLLTVLALGILVVGVPTQAQQDSTGRGLQAIKKTKHKPTRTAVAKKPPVKKPLTSKPKSITKATGSPKGK